ncbi:MAG: glycosyltransferase family 4 protein [Bacteroides sp.]|nr:glycosyltransferase family 4 protein [Bacteroides sp.]MCM1456393.1 glycosyltransferase family 4 protein [Lachnoclostridium sp.]
MRVLVAVNYSKSLFSFRREVIEGLVGAGHLVVISAPDDEAVRRHFEGLGCRYVATEFDRLSKNPLKDMALLRHYKAILREEKIDVALTYTIKPNVYCGVAARMCGVPYLSNITGLGNSIENPGWLQKLTLAMYRVGTARSSCVFFQNAHNLDFLLQKGFKFSNVHLLPGSGVNLDKFSIMPYVAEQDPVRFLYIGRMLKDKGIDHLIDAAQIVRAEFPNVEFHLVGGCQEQQYIDILKEKEACGILFWHGEQNDVKKFIGQSSCLVHPSYHEGMSNVCLENAASGRPVITTNVPGCRETVDDGVTGLLVKPRDTEDLVAKIRRFLSLTYEQRRQMGIRGREKMEREFDRQIVVKAYLDELDNLKK